MRSLLLALAAMLVAAPAAAQHCWPSIVALVVRDADGTVIDPARLDSIAYEPESGATADFRVRPVRIDPGDQNSFARGQTPTLAWSGQGDCRVDMREVVLRRGGEVMRLWMDLHLATGTHPGPSTFILDTPAFGAGTWRLDVCELSRGDLDGFAPIPARWARVSASGDPGVAWQAPQGCGGGTAS
jgi:hypothetical protein